MEIKLGDEIIVKTSRFKIGPESLRLLTRCFERVNKGMSPEEVGLIPLIHRDSNDVRFVNFTDVAEALNRKGGAEWPKE